jgi:hypothetical protein
MTIMRFVVRVYIIDCFFRGIGETSLQGWTVVSLTPEPQLIKLRKRRDNYRREAIE